MPSIPTLNSLLTLHSSFLPLYSGPQVTIRIDDDDQEYKLFKKVICSQSRYFEKMFETSFKESKEQSAVLEPIDGVLTKQSFEMLVQWLHQGRVTFPPLKPEEQITLALEFVRLSDMCEVTGMDAVIAGHIKNIILESPSQSAIMESSRTYQGRDKTWSGRHPDTNTAYLSSQHLLAASELPEDHAVRQLFAIAAVEGYFRSDKPKFREEMREIPSFAVDLLTAVKPAFRSIEVSRLNFDMLFTDPLSGVRVRLSPPVAAG